MNKAEAWAVELKRRAEAVAHATAELERVKQEHAEWYTQTRPSMSIFNAHGRNLRAEILQSGALFLSRGDRSMELTPDAALQLAAFIIETYGEQNGTTIAGRRLIVVPQKEDETGG